MSWRHIWLSSSNRALRSFPLLRPALLPTHGALAVKPIPAHPRHKFALAPMLGKLVVTGGAGKNQNAGFGAEWISHLESPPPHSTSSGAGG